MTIGQATATLIHFLSYLLALLCALAAIFAFLRVAGYAPSQLLGSHEAWAWVTGACAVAAWTLRKYY